MAKSSTLRKNAIGSGPSVDRSGPIAADDLNDFLKTPTETLKADLEAPKAKALASHKPAAPRKAVGQAPPPPAPAAPAAPTEPVIERLMSGEHKSHFLLLADWFEAAVGRRSSDVCVETDVGDVRFEVIDWIDNPGFLKLVVDRSRMPFEPKVLSEMRLRRKDRVYHTTCVSPLSPMFGALPFAEFMLTVDKITTYDPDMEKNARIEPGVTPSAVSGKPSTGVDNEEPVADGEKAASVRGALPAGDFDVSREDEEG